MLSKRSKSTTQTCFLCLCYGSKNANIGLIFKKNYWRNSILIPSKIISLTFLKQDIDQYNSSYKQKIKV